MTDAPTTTTAVDAAQRVYRAWDDALGAKDLDAALALYDADTTLESPLVCHLLGTEGGVVEGHDALRAFVEQVFAHQPAARRRHRTALLADGRYLTWEYPRERPDGEQMDIVEVMELTDAGLIARHRVYWGWRSVAMLSSGEHGR